MKVLKFGGSSVADPQRIRSVAQIISRAASRDRVVVVVSAFQGVTNQLLHCARVAEKGDAGYQQIYDSIARRHRDAVEALLEKRRRKEALVTVDGLLKELHNVLHGISLLRDCPPRAFDLTASFGERLSACIIASYLQQLRPTVFMDARQFTVTDDQFTHAAVLFDPTNKKIRSYFSRLLRRGSPAVIPVVTGFIGATEDGRTTTIGRNGSDYTAAILGAALNSSLIEIWTDVDGILSADPPRFPRLLSSRRCRMKRRWSYRISVQRCSTPPQSHPLSQREFPSTSRIPSTLRLAGRAFQKRQKTGQVLPKE